MTRRHNLSRTAFEYWEAGWNPFPLPRRAKYPPPSGFTGECGRDVTKEDLADWTHQWANIGIRMPDGVVGIDADLYKPGNSLPADLPPTFWSTNRTDGSGIYMYRVPPGTKLQGNIPGVGEVIQYSHRYAVVWPSIHPDGRRYRWYDGNDEPVDIPHIDDLPDLPEKWLKQLQDRPRRRTGHRYSGGLDVWLAELPDGRMSRLVREELKRRTRELRRYQVTGNTRYDTMLAATGRLVALGAQRHRGVADAIDTYWTEYVSVMDGEPNRNPEAELDRAISGAVAKFGGSR